MIDSIEFVKRAMVSLECQSPAQLAEKMGWRRGAERLVSKWLEGQNKPGYAYTVQLADRCGWLNMDVESPVQTTTGDPLAELLATAAATKKTVDSVERRLKRVESRLPKSVEEAPQPQAVERGKPRKPPAKTYTF